jgi:hypothetical protein
MHFDGLSLSHTHGFLLTCSPEYTIPPGVFEIRTEDDGSITADPPQFQMFQCRHAPAEAGAGGRTLFTNTSLIYQQMMPRLMPPR